jgi:hypothetical protein
LGAAGVDDEPRVRGRDDAMDTHIAVRRDFYLGDVRDVGAIRVRAGDPTPASSR